MPPSPPQLAASQATAGVSTQGGCAAVSSTTNAGRPGNASSGSSTLKPLPLPLLVRVSCSTVAVEDHGDETEQEDQLSVNTACGSHRLSCTAKLKRGCFASSLLVTW